MHRIRVGDLGISLDDVGTGEPVILIHGLACGKRMWFHQMRALRARYRVIAYDQRGHGGTDAPGDPKNYSPSQLVRDLSGLLDALGIARASIVGFSLGGGPALGLAANAPHRVSRLVLADVGAGADDMWKSQWVARRWTQFIDRGDIDELVCDMLRSEFFKRYAGRNKRSREHMAGLIRATSPVGSVATGSPPGHGAGASADNLAFPEPSGNTLSRDSDACARISAGSPGCGSLVVHSSKSELLAAAVDNAREGSSERWNGPVIAPLR